MSCAPALGDFEMEAHNLEAPHHTQGSESAARSSHAHMQFLAGFTGFREVDWGKGHKYNGYWKDGKMHGYGTLDSPEGQYVGEFAEHQKCGSGRLMLKNGMMYIGTFDQDLFHGKGALNYSDNSAYSGEFLHGRRHGQGTIVFENGDVYEGEWVEGRREGLGLYVRAEQEEVYEGAFMADRRHGKGELWIKRENSSVYRKSVVEYEEGKMVRQRMRPNSKPKFPSQKPLERFRSSVDKPEIPRVEEDLDDVDIYDEIPAIADVQQDNQQAQASEGVEEEQGDAEASVRPELSFVSNVQDQKTDSSRSWSRMIRNAFNRCLLCLPSGAEFMDLDPSALNDEDKQDSMLNVVIFKLKNMPEFDDRDVDAIYVTSQAGKTVRISKSLHSLTDPEWNEELSMPYSTADKQNLLVSVYLVMHNKKQLLLGSCEVNLSAAHVGLSMPMKHFSLVDSAGRKVEGVSAKDGRMASTKIMMSCSILSEPDALISVRMEAARHLTPTDTQIAGVPFAVVKYNYKELRTTTGLEYDKVRWDQFLSFPSLSQLQLNKIKGKFNFIKWMTVEVWEEEHLGSKRFIGMCKVDFQDLQFGEKGEGRWYNLTDPDRQDLPTVGRVRCWVAWGYKETSKLRVFVEEGLNLSPIFSKSEEKEKGAEKSRGPPMLSAAGSLTQLQPNAMLKVSLGEGQTFKTKVIEQNYCPMWSENFTFKCRQSELPERLNVQCFHRRGRTDEFIGLSLVNLRTLELDGYYLSRWYDLADPELASYMKKYRKEIDEIERGHLKGDDDEEQDNEESNSDDDDDFSAHIINKKGMFGRLTGMNSSQKRANSVAFSYSAGCDPKRVGRWRVELSSLRASPAPQDQNLFAVDQPVVRGGGALQHRPPASQDEGPAAAESLTEVAGKMEV
uniref:C2 domain-containing protein n=2 Tax=Guillardia theta TaxID=55529 RepID=A0A6U6BX21_GUITH|mmetsp:Transcript_41292/g.129772  ORF Transcript_41292/g.129772 Transcript_41292/m.129772 type:complete len:896 (+) Transcript_41292:165-2852(+)